MHLDLMHICKIFMKINRYLCFSFQTFLFMQIDYQIHLRSFNMVTIENDILILSDCICLYVRCVLFIRIIPEYFTNDLN